LSGIVSLIQKLGKFEAIQNVMLKKPTNIPSNVQKKSHLVASRVGYFISSRMSFLLRKRIGLSRDRKKKKEKQCFAETSITFIFRMADEGGIEI
jgi:hypothetical protein